MQCLVFVLTLTFKTSNRKLRYAIIEVTQFDKTTKISCARDCGFLLLLLLLLSKGLVMNKDFLFGEGTLLWNKGAISNHYDVQTICKTSRILRITWLFTQPFEDTKIQKVQYSRIRNLVSIEGKHLFVEM